MINHTDPPFQGRFVIELEPIPGGSFASTPISAKMTNSLPNKNERKQASFVYARICWSHIRIHAIKDANVKDQTSQVLNRSNSFEKKKIKHTHTHTNGRIDNEMHTGALFVCLRVCWSKLTCQILSLSPLCRRSFEYKRVLGRIGCHQSAVCKFTVQTISPHRGHSVESRSTDSHTRCIRKR